MMRTHPGSNNWKEVFTNEFTADVSSTFDNLQQENKLTVHKLAYTSQFQ